MLAEMDVPFLEPEASWLETSLEQNEDGRCIAIVEPTAQLCRYWTKTYASKDAALIDLHRRGLLFDSQCRAISGYPSRTSWPRLDVRVQNITEALQGFARYPRGRQWLQ